MTFGSPFTLLGETKVVISLDNVHGGGGGGTISLVEDKTVTRKPPVQSIPSYPVMYLNSISRNMTDYYGKCQKRAWQIRWWRWVTLCEALPAIYKRGAGGCALPLKKIKQVVKSGTASQQSAGEGCLQTASSPRPDQPQPRPSDVCVPSLMKKFWYLGETLLSAE